MHPRLALLRVPSLFLLSLALAFPLAAQRSDAEWLEDCREDDHGRKVSFCEIRDVSMPAPARLEVDAGENGPVAIYGADRRDVAASARIKARARTEADARALVGRVQILTDGGRLRADGPSSGDWWVSFIVDVPRTIDLEAHTSNGPLSVADVSGRMVLSARNGPLSLRDLGGDVRARAENGPLSVSLSGDRWQGAGLDAETRNGPLTLRIPQDYSARLEAGTVNGPMDVDFPMTVTIEGRVSRRFTATLGSGGALVRAVTTNGPVSIRRR